MTKIGISFLSKAIFSGFFVAFPSLMVAQKVIFKDKNFERAAISMFDTNKNKSIEANEIASVTNLFLAEKNILIADDIELFPNVEMVMMDGNPVVGMQLKNLPKLGFFSCSDCKLVSFFAENLPQLNTLHLDKNKIRTIVFNNTPSIYQLTLSYNEIQDIKLDGLKKLKKLNLEGNQIKKLNLKSNINLETLNIVRNPAQDRDLILPSSNKFRVFSDQNHQYED